MGEGKHARQQPAHREQLGVQSLAQGLFDTNPEGAGFELGTFREPSSLQRRFLYPGATVACACA